MNTRCAWVVVAAVLAGCSSEWSSGLGLQPPAGASDTAVPGSGLPRSLAGARPTGSARAPDRGDLLGYPAQPVVRHAAGHAWHAAALSEDHALRAIVRGRMRVTAPDGTPIALDYVRHVEHPDGNWSWIGRNADAPGQAAVVTFGPEAAFGSIPQGRGLPPLRLTRADGVGWVVSAGPRPPHVPGGSAGPQEASDTPATRAGRPATIDLLVGYTRGFASARGGASAALTRIHNLVDSANEAYAYRGVAARLRLVHSMPVTTADATAHTAAPGALADAQSIAMPPTDALGAARDRYGADRVVLLRPPVVAGKDRCATARREASGRPGVGPREQRQGYPVVVDGPGRDAGGQARFCGEEDFAHVLFEDLATAGNVASVVALRASVDATAVPKGDVDASGTTDLTWFKWGSLDIWLMGGHIVTGQVGYSTGTRLFPYVEGEFNATPGRDIAWRDHYWDGNVFFWWGGPTYTRPWYTYGMSWAWRLQASGDRNGDGISDLYWRSAVDGRLMYWEMSPTEPIRRSYMAFAQSLDADLLMVGDFNGDGLSDLFFRTRATGASEIWFPDGDGYTVAPRGRMSKYWLPAGAADYDGDGDDDLVWRSAVDYRVLVWIMQDGLRQDVAVFPSDSDRQLLAVGYLNADRRLDLVWRRADGSVSTWLNTGGGFEHRYIGNRDASWTLFTGGR